MPSQARGSPPSRHRRQREECPLLRCPRLRREPGSEGLVPDHQRPRDPCVLVGEGDRDNVRRAPHQKVAQPGAPPPVPAHHRASAVYEQPPEIPVAALADPTEPFLAAAGTLSRNQSEPGCEL